MYLAIILPALFAVWGGCFFFCEFRASRKEAKRKLERDAARAARLRAVMRPEVS